MDFVSGKSYHIYNRGNFNTPIFYQPRNYEYFLEKIREHILPNCEIISYSLMPYQFKFLIHANERTQKTIKRGMILTNPLSEGFRQMLSHYSQGVNRQEHRTGNLFRQNTKFKCLSLKHTDYSNVCFKYIHQHVYTSGLSDKIESWPYSSFNEYLFPATGNICNVEMAMEILNLKMEQFYSDAYAEIREQLIEAIF
jgi:putative transposase